MRAPRSIVPRHGRRPVLRTRRDLRLLVLLALVLAVAYLLLSPPDGGGAAVAAEERPRDERLEEFDPSEEVSADSALSFPVDI